MNPQKSSIKAEPFACKPMYRFTKRLLDLLGALLGLLLLWPLLALVALLVRFSMGSPILFRQTRIGLMNRRFQIFKFRTMLDSRDSEGRLLPDADRLCPIGRFIRASSLDELPQLWNVLVGDMSFVGPRPLLPEYLPRYSARQRRRHEVMPGITGWAQVLGRNSLSWNDKLAMDVWYVDHCNIVLDCRILGLTAIRVIRRDGIAASGHATMAEFLGADDEPAPIDPLPDLASPPTPRRT